jgi:putative ABC transport system ATP-binding protein
VKSPLAPAAGGAISPAAIGSGGASVVATGALNVTAMGPVPTKQLGPPVLVLKNISKSFPVDGGNEIVHALHSISLCEPDQADGFSFPAIRQGEFVMVRGPSGGGKTTLLNMVGTIDAPTKGTIELMGEKITKDSPDTYLADLRLRRIGFVFQTFNLLPTMSALENVELPMTLVGKLNEHERRSRAKQLLALVGLRNRVHHLPSELSGGEQQRVTIARALANNPDLLLLDEPTGDLDTATTIQVMDLLLQINCMSGTTCIMVTHNPDVECYADRILYVADGRFVRQAVNTRPVPLVRDDYEEYLKEMERRQTQLMLNRNQEGNVKPTATNMASVEF